VYVGSGAENGSTVPVAGTKVGSNQNGLNDAMKVAIHIVGSILLSIPMLYAVGGILDVTGLMPGWGFWHGPVIIAWPICVLIAFAVLLAVPWFRRD
jgi:hypothetical protein